MSFDPSYLVSQLSAIDREEGDIRLKCQGEVVKAHSLILSMRYSRGFGNHLLLIYSIAIYYEWVNY